MDYQEIDHENLFKMITNIEIEFIRIMTIQEFLIELNQKKNELDLKSKKKKIFLNFNQFFQFYKKKLKREIQSNLYEFKFTYNKKTWKLFKKNKKNFSRF